MNFDSETTITMYYKNGKTEEFSIFSLARWLGLIEAFEYINEFVDEHNIDFDNCDFIKKPASIFEFINAKQPKIEEHILRYCTKYNLQTDYIFELM